MSDDEISRFDDFVATSSSPHELLIKSMVGGLRDVLTIDDCINLLIDRIFDIRRNNTRCSNSDYLKHAVRILKTIKDRDVISRCILNKSKYSSIVMGILHIIRQYFSFFSSVNASSGPLLNEFIRYSMVISHFDKNFIPNLRDMDGNNLLMIISIAAGFDEGEKMLRRTGMYQRGGLETYIETSPLREVLWALSRDIGCDIYCKNLKGICFASFFSQEFIEKMGLLNPESERKSDLT